MHFGRPSTAAARVALTLTLACGSEAAQQRAPDPAPDITGRFDVHEWGLIGTALGSDRVALATRPRPPPAGGGGGDGALGLGAGHSIGKPVIYVHADEDLAAPIRVRVGVPGGRVLERLPAGSVARDRDGELLIWADLRVGRGACPSTRRIVADDPECAEVADGYCEAAEDARYDTEDASCLTTATGERRNHLFYRAEATFDPPLQIRREGDAIVARNRGDAAIPGELIRVRRVPVGPTELTEIARVSPPPPGGEVTLPHPRFDGLADFAALLERAFVERGLRLSEARAFARGWGEVLWGAEPDRSAQVAVGEPPPGLGPVRDAVFYWMPDDELERRVPLTVEPRPRAIRRALLVRVALTDP